MKTYFITSDLHGCFSPFYQALIDKGFKAGNQNHILIICGDLFDRGVENVKIFNYLYSFPMNRLVLIRGNHEQLLLDLLDRGYATQGDVSNGTVQTIQEFTGIKELSKIPYAITIFKTLPVYKWLIDPRRWVDYYELDNYICVHSFIPVISGSFTAVYDSMVKYLKPNPNWREEASKEDWLYAAWGCPFILMDAGLYTEKKKLICGHWSCSDFYKHYGVKADRSMYDIFENDKIVALDATTILSNKVNIYIVKE